MAASGQGHVDRWSVLRPHLEDGVPLVGAAADAGVPIRTARRWLAAYRAGGPAGLRRLPRADRGQRRTPAELVRAVEGLALRRPRPRTAYVHRQAVAIAVEHGWPVPSYSTVRSIITGLDPAWSPWPTTDRPAYRDRYELVYRRQAARANEQWRPTTPSSTSWCSTQPADRRGRG